MATLRIKTLVLVLLINLVKENRCENDVKPQNHVMEEIAEAEHLLRGSNEGRPIEETPIPIAKVNVKETDVKEPIKQTASIVNKTKAVETIVMPIKPVEKSVERTTIADVTTTDADTPSGFMPEDNNNKSGEDIRYNDYESETTPAYVTETVTDPITLTTIDNNVYKSREVMEDIYNASDNIDGKTDSTSTVATTRSPMVLLSTKAMNELEPLLLKVPSKDDVVDAPGVRSPKTENTERIPLIEKRTFDHRPEFPVAVSKSSILKNWLENSWLRPPAGILIPLRPMALTRALAIWNELTAEGLNLTDIVIVGYDSNGVNWRSRHNLQNRGSVGGYRAVSEALSKLILKYQGVNNDNSVDGTMRALASATKLVPYDSALFVVTDKGPGDLQRYPLALRALVEKRLKLYTIWTDPLYPSPESELALQGLKNISLYTEGNVLPHSVKVPDMDHSNSANDSYNWGKADLSQTQARRARLHYQVENNNFETLLVRRGGGGATSLGVPVENGVTALRIYIEGAVEHAVLYPPNDAPQIDLYNVSSVRAFSPSSRTDGLSPRDVYLVFPGADTAKDMLTVLPAIMSTEAPAPTVGLWHLSVRCDTCDYRLAVAARGLIHFDTQPQPHDMLKLKVTGPVASVRESLLVNEYGAELSKLPFSYQPIRADGQTIPLDGPVSELTADVKMPKVEGSKIYARIVGRDIHGHPFARLSGPLNHTEIRMGRSASIRFPDAIDDLERAEELNGKLYASRNLNPYNETSALPSNRALSQTVNQQGYILSSVQIGLGTRLYGAPGASLQLQYEVTNYRDRSVRYTFEAIGELRFLTGINTNAQTLDPGQTTIVIVYATITANAQPGARDRVTFTATSNAEQIAISAYIYVTNPETLTSDVWPPEMRHTFQGTCLGNLGADCASHTWSANIIAKDTVGGLLRLTSSPLGLVYTSDFVSGTREEVVATYRATCCAPRVVVTAVDSFGNANSYIVDISNYFTQAAVAAIVLGVFLAIAIIAVIVFLIYLCVKRRRESRELPASYTSSRKNLG